MPQLFPCLKLIDESEDPNSLISEFQIKGSKSKSHLQLFTEWLIKKNAHVLAIDIRETLIVDFLLKKFQSEQQEVFKILREYLNQPTVKIEAFLEKSQFVLQNYCDPILYPYGITIDDQIITDSSITSTFKGFFCHRCCLYDCRNHENKKEHNFAHPMTQLTDSKRQEDIQWLLTFQKEYLEANIPYPNPDEECAARESTSLSAPLTTQTNSINTTPIKNNNSNNNNNNGENMNSNTHNNNNNNNTINMNIESDSNDMKPTIRMKCSQSCYLKLTPGEMEKFNKKTYNEFEHAFIKAGAKRVSYNPCLLHLIDRRFTCAEMFVYLIQKTELHSVMQGKKQDKRHRTHHHHSSNHSHRPHSNKSYFNQHLYYEPCCHYFYDEDAKDQTCNECGCSKRGFCDIYCGCDPNRCKRRRVGCKCVKGMCKTKKCACFALGMECDPEQCRECFGCRKGRCQNNEYLYQKQERTVIGMSFVCKGLGLYNVFPIKANQLVLSYLGEYISEDEQVIRESWLKSMIFYTFTKNDFEKLVDSKYFGNKSRFLNHHMVLENCYARSVYSRGDYHLGLYAKQDIPPGHELLFDYDADQTLAKENTWITEPSYKNYKIRRDNIRICIPLNRPIVDSNGMSYPLAKEVILIEDSSDAKQEQQQQQCENQPLSNEEDDDDPEDDNDRDNNVNDDEDDDDDDDDDEGAEEGDQDDDEDEIDQEEPDIDNIGGVQRIIEEDDQLRSNVQRATTVESLKPVVSAGRSNAISRAPPKNWQRQIASESMIDSESHESDEDFRP